MQRQRLNLFKAFLIILLTACFSTHSFSSTVTDSSLTASDSIISSIENAFISGDFSEARLLYAAKKYQSTKKFNNEIIARHQLLLLKPTWSEAGVIEQKAKNVKLIGYQYTEWERIGFFVSQFRVVTLIISLTLMTAFILWATYLIRFKETNPYWVVILIPIALLLLMLNNKSSFQSNEGYCTHENTLLFKDPSPGSDLLHESQKGERITHLSDLGNWYEGTLNGQKVFVRKQDINGYFK